MKRFLNPILRYIYNHSWRKFIAEDIRGEILALDAVGNNTSPTNIQAKAAFALVAQDKSPRWDINLVMDKNSSVTDKNEIFRRDQFYFPNNNIRIINDHNLLHPNSQDIYLINTTKLYSQFSQEFPSLRAQIFNVDYMQNPDSAGQWHQALTKVKNLSSHLVINHSRDRFFSYFNHHQFRFSKLYIFGTGPSLANYRRFSYDDGFRIVCNTIVKDQPTWQYINPHIIVAADTVFHFGPSSYAQKFRKDLKKRLSESPQTLFIYPHFFHAYVSGEFSAFKNQLIPIPTNPNLHSIQPLSQDKYYLPALGNILNFMLLPIACTFSKNLYLLGFDGKKKTDKFFWSHSPKHNYLEDIDLLNELYPAYFKHHLPAQSKNAYITKNMGEPLNRNLIRLENKGWSFTVMNPSYTQSLNKRWNKAQFPA